VSHHDRPDERDRPISLSSGDPLAALAGWVAAGRVDEAARARARQRWLERQADEEATLGGILLDLAERSRPVLVSTSAGRRLRGPLRMVGTDFAIVREPQLGDVLVPFRVLTSVRPTPGDPGASGDRPFTVELTLAASLLELAADRPEVLVIAGPDEHRGELRSAGIDVIGIVLDGARSTVHVNVATIDHLALLIR